MTLYDRKCKFTVVQRALRIAEKSDTIKLHFMSLHRLTDPETSRFRVLASMQVETTYAFKATHCMVEVLARAHLEAAPCDPASCELVAHQKAEQLQSVKQQQKHLQNPGAGVCRSGCHPTMTATCQGGLAWASHWPWGSIPKLTNLPACS